MTILRRQSLEGTGGGSISAAASIASTMTHKYRLSQGPTQSFPGGTFRLASQREFPISATMAGAMLTLKPGARRELHWHPNANEFQYYAKGKARMTVFGSDGGSERVEFEAGDVGYVPLGYGHAIENIGSEDLLVILTFDSGDYQEISLTDWLSQTLPSVLAANCVAPDSTFASFPNENLFITIETRDDPQPVPRL
ncbi:MAG: oxalate decarboxylase [Rhodospirillales bacterium]|nr:oxalate decarboxylase [Rhodospirillales bacterium]